jgi:hypothetical protein
MYNKSLQELSIKYNAKFIIVDEEFAPVRLVEVSDLVISRACSSTALQQ